MFVTMLKGNPKALDTELNRFQWNVYGINKRIFNKILQKAEGTLRKTVSEKKTQQCINQLLIYPTVVIKKIGSLSTISCYTSRDNWIENDKSTASSTHNNNIIKNTELKKNKYLKILEKYSKILAKKNIYNNEDNTNNSVGLKLSKERKRLKDSAENMTSKKLIKRKRISCLTVSSLEEKKQPPKKLLQHSKSFSDIHKDKRNNLLSLNSQKIKVIQKIFKNKSNVICENNKSLKDKHIKQKSKHIHKENVFHENKENSTFIKDKKKKRHRSSVDSGIARSSLSTEILQDLEKKEFEIDCKNNRSEKCCSKSSENSSKSKRGVDILELEEQVKKLKEELELVVKQGRSSKKAKLSSLPTISDCSLFEENNNSTNGVDLMKNNVSLLEERCDNISSAMMVPDDQRLNELKVNENIHEEVRGLMTSIVDEYSSRKKTNNSRTTKANVINENEAVNKLNKTTKNLSNNGMLSLTYSLISHLEESNVSTVAQRSNGGPSDVQVDSQLAKNSNIFKKSTTSRLAEGLDKGKEKKHELSAPAIASTSVQTKFTKKTKESELDLKSNRSNKDTTVTKKRAYNKKSSKRQFHQTTNVISSSIPIYKNPIIMYNYVQPPPANVNIISVQNIVLLSPKTAIPTSTPSSVVLSPSTSNVVTPVISEPIYRVKTSLIASQTLSPTKLPSLQSSSDLQVSSSRGNISTALVSPATSTVIPESSRLKTESMNSGTMSPIESSTTTDSAVPMSTTEQFSTPKSRSQSSELNYSCSSLSTSTIESSSLCSPCDVNAVSNPPHICRQNDNFHQKSISSYDGVVKTIIRCILQMRAFKTNWRRQHPINHEMKSILRIAQIAVFYMRHLAGYLKITSWRVLMHKIAVYSQTSKVCNQSILAKEINEMVYFYVGCFHKNMLPQVQSQKQTSSAVHPAPKATRYFSPQATDTFCPNVFSPNSTLQGTPGHGFFDQQRRFPAPVPSPSHTLPSCSQGSYAASNYCGSNPQGLSHSLLSYLLKNTPQTDVTLASNVVMTNEQKIKLYCQIKIYEQLARRTNDLITNQQMLLAQKFQIDASSQIEPCNQQQLVDQESTKVNEIYDFIRINENRKQEKTNENIDKVERKKNLHSILARILEKKKCSDQNKQETTKIIICRRNIESNESMILSNKESVKPNLLLQDDVNENSNKIDSPAVTEKCIKEEPDGFDNTCQEVTAEILSLPSSPEFTANQNLLFTPIIAAVTSIPHEVFDVIDEDIEDVVNTMEKLYDTSEIKIEPEDNDLKIHFE